MDADLGLADIYASWFGSVHEDLDEETQELVFLHFRSAYLTGRIQGQADIVPLVHAHADDMKRVAAIFEGDA